MRLIKSFSFFLAHEVQQKRNLLCGEVFTINLNAMGGMNAALELFGAMLTLVMLVSCFWDGLSRSAVGKYLMLLLLTHTLMLLVDAPIWMLLDRPAPEKVLWIKVLSFFSDAFLHISLVLYAYCVTAYIAERKEVSACGAKVVAVLCAAALALCLLSVFNEMYIGYDETGQDITGPLYLLSQLLLLSMLAPTLLLIWRNRCTLGSRGTWAFLLYGLIPMLSIPFQIFWAITPYYLLGATCAHVLVYTMLHIEQAQRTAEMEKQIISQQLTLSESQNALMLSQIQPHFLYNALTSIYRLCDTKPEAAKVAVSNFAKYLRGNLDSISRSELISFSEELRHTQAYLALQELRYGEDLTIIYDIRTETFSIPPLTIEPLVENAVEHGISDLPDGGSVTLSTAETADCYEVRVCDDGVGFDPAVVNRDDRPHIGISAVRSRLAILCNGTLTIESAPGQGTTAVIRIPKEYQV